MLEALSCLSFEAMGCRFELMLGAEGSRLDAWSVRAVGEEIRELVLDWHRRLSVFDTESDVSRINRAPVGAAISLDDELFTLLLLCERLRERTQGAFNIAAGTLMRVHGFRECPASPGAARGLDLARVFVLDESERTITRMHELATLDFGAIAKGFVLDLIRGVLEEYGIKHAYIHGGTSSILAIGQDPHTYPWTTVIDRDLRVHLSGYSMGVSEGSSRVIERDGEPIGHVMDMQTNTPAASRITSMVCVHPSAAVADAYSTACLARPALIDHMCLHHRDDPCILIAIDPDAPPFIHDPLGVVVQRPEDISCKILIDGPF